MDLPLAENEEAWARRTAKEGCDALLADLYKYHKRLAPKRPRRPRVIRSARPVAPPPPPPPPRILRGRHCINLAMAASARHFGVAAGLVFSRSQISLIVKVRHVGFYVANVVIGRSLSEIGRRIGRDHTTVLHGVKKVRRQLQTGEITQTDIDAVTAIVLHLKKGGP